MVKRIAVVACVLWMIGALSGWCYAPTGKISPALQRMIHLYQSQGPLALGKTGNVEDRSRLSMIASGRLQAADVARRGGVLRWQRDGFAIINAPAAAVENLLQVPGLTWLEADQMALPTADVSMKEIGAIAARENTGLTGKGVLIGIVDSGIDWTHPDFLSSDGKTRIKYIFDMSVNGPYYGGTVYTEDDINASLAGAAIVKQHDFSGHGSHVAGIAAGDGSTTKNYGGYAGVAPEANLIIVKATRNTYTSEFSSSDQLLAIDFIDSAAAVLGQPCVINLSFGSLFGAHDGTSAVERFIDMVSGPGRVVVAASGNEGGKKTHAQAELGTTTAQVSVTIPEYSANAGSGNDLFVLDGWYDGGNSVTVTVISPRGQIFGPVADGGYLGKNSIDGQVLIWNGLYDTGSDIVPGVDPYNQDKEIVIQVGDDLGTAPRAGEWTVRMSGRSGSVHFWMANKSMEAVFNEGVSDRMSLTIPSTSKSAISVGAYTTRETWHDLDGNNLTIDTKGDITVGDVAEFSGAGPSRDNRIKPEITAPGRIVGSTMSSDADPSGLYSIFVSPDGSFPNAFVLEDGLHAMSLGTSMAAPHVSGTVALLLEKYPTADAARIKQALIYTVRAMSAAKRDQWGYGKINCAAAAALRLEDLPEDPDNHPPVTFKVSRPYPNPFNYSTMVDYEIPLTAGGENQLTIHIYNSLGQAVRSLYDGRVSSGRYSILWNGRNSVNQPVASGVYFIEFKYGSNRLIEKICLLAGK